MARKTAEQRWQERQELMEYLDSELGKDWHLRRRPTMREYMATKDAEEAVNTELTKSDPPLRRKLCQRLPYEEATILAAEVLIETPGANSVG